MHACRKAGQTCAHKTICKLLITRSIDRSIEMSVDYETMCVCVCVCVSLSVSLFSNGLSHRRTLLSLIE